MTTTRQHIEDLDVDKWAALTRRAAVDSIAAAERLGMQPRPESVALAGMSERALVEHRERNGPPRKRLSLAMQLVEADHLRRAAEGQAREAHQSRLDADAATSLARAEAGESARVATAASERVRAVEAEAARKDAERAAERAANQKALQQAQAEIERVRAGAAAEVAAAQEKVRAAEARAVERSTERTTERAAGEKAVQGLQAEIERVRAGAAAEVAAAEEKVRAAEARADQRSTERTTERATGEEAVQRARSELEKVRSDAAAEVAAARGKASGEVAAGRQAAEAEVAAGRQAAEAEVAAGRQAAEAEVAAARQAADAEVAAARQAADAEVAAARQAAEAEVAHWQAHAEDMERWAQAEVSAVASTRLLTIPIPPMEVRARIGSIESALDALYQIDYVLEVGLADEVESQFPPDLELTRNLAWRVQEQAKDLADELASLSTRYVDQPQVDAAAGYAEAATGAHRAFLQRIDVAVRRLGRRFQSPDAEIVGAVTTMLDDLRAQGLYQSSDGG
jgi:colicin import membrane protein